MNVNSNSITERRRLVYSALARYLKQDRLLEALWLWEQKYALTSNLELRKFVSEIILQDDSPELKSKIYKSLTKATYFPGEIELLPDPYDAMHAYRESCNGSFKFISPFNDDLSAPYSTLVFQCLLQSMLHRIQDENSIVHMKIVRKLKTKLSNRSLEIAQHRELVLWLDNKSNSLKLLYSEKFMSAFVNDLYVLSCEFLGPVVTDRLLAKSLQDTDELEEARFFNPKRLM